MYSRGDQFGLRTSGILAGIMACFAMGPMANALQAQTVISTNCPALQTVASFKAGDYFVVSSFLDEEPDENNPGEGLTVITAYNNGTVVRNDLSLLLPGTPVYSTDPPVVAAADGTVKACFTYLDGDETPTVTYKLLSTNAEIKIAPSNPTVTAGGTQQFSAIGIFPDGGSLDVTGQVTWTSSAAGISTINAEGTAAGKATGVSPGMASITAALGPASGLANLTVTAGAAPLSLSCAPPGGPAIFGIVYTAVCTASGGVAPYSWSIANGPLPAGLSMTTHTNSSIRIAGSPSAAGSYSYTVQVSDGSTPAAAASQSYSGAISAPLLSISQPSLTFSAPLGSIARTQQIDVTSNPAGMMYTAVAAPECLWLSLAGATGTTNGTISLSANGVQVSSPGTYNCKVTVTPVGGGPAQSVYVAFIVRGVNLHTRPTSLTFTYPAGGSPPGAQSFTVSSDSGTGARFTARPGCSWVSLNPAGATAPGNVDVTVDPGSIGPGEYSCSVGIDGAGAANRPEVTVRLSVSSPPVAEPGQFMLAAVRGVQTPVVKTIGISGPGAPLNFTATPATDSGGGWLSLDTLSGATPANLTVQADPSNLATGTYHGTVTITFDDRQTQPLSVDVTLAVSDRTMTAVPSSLEFRYQQGGTAPPPQVISVVTSDGPAADFTAVASGPISVTSGPGAQNVTVTPSAMLAAGTYTNASVTVASATTRSQTVPVTIMVDPRALPSPVLSLSAPGLTYSFTQGGAPGTQTLTLSNSGGGTLNIITSTSTNSGGEWLSASCAPGKISSTSPGVCSVTADPAKVIPDDMGSAAGTYLGQVTIATDVLGQHAVVPVIMTLTPLPLIVLSTNGLSFTPVAGATAPTAGSIEILNSAPGTLKWTAEASALDPGGTWLKLGASSGTANSTNAAKLQVMVDQNMLPPRSPAGAYYGSVLISATDEASGKPAANSPRTVTIVIPAGGSGPHSSPQVTPSGLVFSAAAGTANVPSQSITIDTGGTALSYNLIAITDDGGSWCAAIPSAGALHNSGTVNVQVDFTNSSLLRGSIHRCYLRILFAGGSFQEINVTALVTSAVCDSPKWLANVNRPQQNSMVAAYVPASWEISVTDSCTGQPITWISNLTLFFSNGDPPQQLINRSSSTGIYSGSWTPVNISANQAHSRVGIYAIGNGEISPTVMVDVAQQVKNVPRITGVVNSASYTPASLAAPCSWVSIFGSNLGDGTVRLAEMPLALEYVSDGQINAQIPCGLQPNAPQDIIAVTGGGESVSQRLIYASTAPAIFTADQSGYGQAAVFWTTPSGDHVLADQTHPVPAGAVVEIYCTGLGLTNPVVKEGTPSPAPAAAVSQSVGVSIGDMPGEVQFAGLSPGAVGLYQVNAAIPDGVAAGDSVSVTVGSGGRYSQPGATIAVK